MSRTRTVVLLACSVAILAPRTADSQTSRSPRPRISADLLANLHGQGAAARLSIARWSALVRLSRFSDRQGGGFRTEEGSTNRFEKLHETAFLVERVLRIGATQAITVAAGLGRWSGEEASGPGRESCSTSVFFGTGCSTYYDITTVEPTWGPTGEAFYHLSVADTWRFLAGIRLSPRSSLSRVYAGIGFGGLGT